VAIQCHRAAVGQGQLQPAKRGGLCLGLWCHPATSRTTSWCVSVSQDDSDEARRARITDVMGRGHIKAHQLWLYYFSMGGNVDELEVSAYLHGLMPLPAVDQDLLALAVAEMYADI
jgi:hypothetical protein